MTRARPLTLLLSAALLATACATDEPPASPPPPTPDAAVPAVGAGLVVVLPPSDGLAPVERHDLRRAVERAVVAVLPEDGGLGTVVVLEPADASAVVDTVERAVRRVGPGGTVCVVGAGVRERIAPVLALYPATRACLLPAPPLEGDGHLALDVDLEHLGRELGVAARAVAGQGTVVVLDAGDALLDRRWRIGVSSGVLDPDVLGSPGRIHTVRSAEDLLRLLDDQAALIDDGIVPGSPEALDATDGLDALLGLDVDPVPPALALPPVAVVVLDASQEAARAVGPLAERGLRVIGPRTLLDADAIGDEMVVARWHVRWQLPLAALLDAVLTGEGPPPTIEDVVVVAPGPAGRG